MLAPGYAPLEFIAPEPGSYGLPTMGVASDGEVLDSDGNKVRLHDFIGDKPNVQILRMQFKGSRQCADSPIGGF